LGVDGTASRRYMGPLPALGQWVRLEVPAALVGLEGRLVNGMAFTTFNGRVTWDRSGKRPSGIATFQISGTATLNGAALANVALGATGGVSCTNSNAAGQYSCTVPSGWSGTVTPALSGYTFTPASRSYSSVAANQGAQNYAAAAVPTTYALSGTVTLGGAALANVALGATNGVSCTTSNAAGQYSCTAPAGWSGTVTPALSGYTFTPASRSYSSVAANQTAQDYAAAAVPTTYALSGTVTLGGAALGNVALAANNGVSCTNSNASGQYSCTVPAGWGGTVTPALSGYTFTPASRSYSSVAANQGAQNYAASVVAVTTYALSGTVTLNGAALTNVALAATNGVSCTNSNASGQYSCTAPAGWSGTVTPALLGYVFTPISRSYVGVVANQAVQDYSGAAVTVWFDDAIPVGATAVGQTDGWNWVGSNPAPVSGTLSHQSALLSGEHQHLFMSDPNPFAVGVGDTLFTYVYLDPANPPSQIMLKWNDGSWAHRAYWGADIMQTGVNGTDSRRYMGPLPALGQWVRLEVPAALVGLEGRLVNGMAFTTFNGRSTWDYTGKITAAGTSTYQVSGTVTLGGSALANVALGATGGVSCTNSNAAGQYSCTAPAGWSGTVTPALSGYTFTPASRSYSSVAANQSVQDYAAAL